MARPRNIRERFDLFKIPLINKDFKLTDLVTDVLDKTRVPIDKVNKNSGNERDAFACAKHVVDEIVDSVETGIGEERAIKAQSLNAKRETMSFIHCLTKVASSPKNDVKVDEEDTEA